MIEDRDLEEIVGRDIVGVMINPGSVSLYFNGADGRGGMDFGAMSIRV
ncbi:hypothetical protein [Burkholderia gladioli]|nr:hypothetical protein [Burkholderia gladioli]